MTDVRMPIRFTVTAATKWKLEGQETRWEDYVIEDKRIPAIKKWRSQTQNRDVWRKLL